MNFTSPSLIQMTILTMAMVGWLSANPPATNSRIFTVEAKPEAITIDASRTALIVVDMQNDFASEGGMFDRCGADISGIRKVIEPTAKVLTAARRARIRIIYLKMGFKPDLSDLGAIDSVSRVRYLRAGVGQAIRAPNGKESKVLIRDTWNTDIVDELKPEPGDGIVYKTRYSGFYKTELDSTLKAAGIRNLIVAGCTTSVCVDSTVRDAMFRDYLCVALNDCMSEPIGGASHNASLSVMEIALGWVSDSSQFIKSITLPTAAESHSK